MKYIVFAFYRNLGIKCRVLPFNSKRDMYEYVCGLRLTDTSYVIEDVTDAENPKTVEYEAYDFTLEEIKQMLTELIEREEE